MRPFKRRIRSIMLVLAALPIAAGSIVGTAGTAVSVNGFQPAHTLTSEEVSEMADLAAGHSYPKHVHDQNECQNFLGRQCNFAEWRDMIRDTITHPTDSYARRYGGDVYWRTTGDSQLQGMIVILNPANPDRSTAFLTTYAYYQNDATRSGLATGAAAVCGISGPGGKKRSADQSPTSSASSCPGIDASFRSSRKDEVYLFRGNQYALVKSAPGTTDDKIINGPKAIAEGWPSLKGTVFENGIDAAVQSPANTEEVYLFKGDQYALVNYAPGTTGDKIINGPKAITEGWPSLKGTVFEKGVDAALRSSRKDEVYLFKGDQYALVKSAPGTTDDKIINGPKAITEGWPSLKGTVFENGIDAAVQSPANTEEVYLFTEDQYVLVNYAPGTTDDKIINGPKLIAEGWPSLKGTVFAS
ncbi:hemopexin repeat-containing protein [Streptomyces sioyaensis]|uniref:hemopexin repeat-containing protein n=1 Tax=Streptomyces sioyaensis TaxID=67364 RepID=UPI0037B9E93E